MATQQYDQGKMGFSDPPSGNVQLVPLVVDLDGTLTSTDTLMESVLQLLKRDPWALLKFPIWLIKGRAAFKQFAASRSGLLVESLPWREPFIEFLRSEKQRGRRIILATAADRDIAIATAQHLGLFDEVISSDGMQNLKGAKKLVAIKKLTNDQFVYAGDSRADIPIWKSAAGAILVGVRPEVADTVRHYTPIEKEFPRSRQGLKVWLRALRVHQWLKNLLVFVPLLTAFSFLEKDALWRGVLGFIAFCLTASATYIVNDLRDLENDRAHPRKRNRPFASGEISIAYGLVVASCLLLAGLGFGVAVSESFCLMVVLYIAVTTVYSWMLKEYVLIDVMTLSLLYTLRILAGSVAVNVDVTSWLLAFSVFVFMSLALIKRCSELVALEHLGRNAACGRNYGVKDLVVLWPLGVGSAMCAVVVFGLFIDAPHTQTNYANPQMLWLVAIALIYWLARLWIKTARGEMHDDPLVFAVRDFGSRMTILVMILASLVARLFPWH